MSTSKYSYIIICKENTSMKERMRTDFNLVGQTVVGDFELGIVPRDSHLPDNVFVGSEEAHLVLERLAQLLAGLHTVSVEFERR